MSINYKISNKKKKNIKNMSNKKTKKSPVKGWSKKAPKTKKERIKLLEKCGEKCFLKPSMLKFPICDKKTQKKSCKLSCKGLLSAKIRAKQWGYEDVYKKADNLIKKHKCQEKKWKN